MLWNELYGDVMLKEEKKNPRTHIQTRAIFACSTKHKNVWFFLFLDKRHFTRKQDFNCDMIQSNIELKTWWDKRGKSRSLCLSTGGWAESIWFWTSNLFKLMACFDCTVVTFCLWHITQPFCLVEHRGNHELFVSRARTRTFYQTLYYQPKYWNWCKCSHVCRKKKQSNGFIEPSNSCIQKRFVRAIQYVFYGCSFWLLSPHVLNIYINCCLNSTPTPVQAMRCGAIVRISYYRKWTNNNGKTHNQKLSMDVNGK